MPRNDDPVEVNCVYKGTTWAGGSYKIEDANGKFHTLPASQVSLDPTDPDEDDDVTITMPEWLATDRGLV